MALKHDFSLLSRDWRRPPELPAPPADFNFAFDVIDDRAREADKTALICFGADGSGRREVRYADLSRASTRFGQALLRLGLGKGDFTALIAGRRPEWHEALFGCMKAGVAAMPGTTLLTAKDIAQRINRAGAKAAIVTPEHVEKIDAIFDECPTLEHRIVIGDAPDGWLAFAALCDAETGEATRADFPPTGASDEMLVYFTSGTTALPKMVPRDHAYAYAHALTALYWMDLSESDVHWAVTDTGWAKAAWGLLFPQFCMGATVVMHDAAAGFDPDLHLRMIGEVGVTSFCAPPTVYRIFAQMDVSAFELSSLRRCIGAGEPLNPEVIRFWRRHTDLTVADGYGQTETINIVGNFVGLEPRAGSMGKPVPGFDVDVVDDGGARRPVGEIGHIAVNVGGAWPPGLFSGYRTEDGLDRSSFKHGWYYSGDTAYRDEDGYFWFIGRADDVISSAGYRISPFEVESALLAHPAVAESAVVGAPDEERGEVVKAWIVLAAGAAPSAELMEEIQTFCKTETAPYKYPRRIEFVEALPKTVSGKIRRVELRARG